MSPPQTSALVCLSIWVISLLAFHPLTVTAQDKTAKADADMVYSLAELNTSEAADLLLSRADTLSRALTEGKEKEKNWNDIIQMYAAVLKQYPGAVHGVGDNVYIPVTTYCRNQILRFPQDGLDAFRARHDSEAERKLGQARRNMDTAELREIVNAYFATSSGDDACLDLANVFIESAQYDAALNMLNHISKHPAPDVNAAAVWIRKAICLKKTGRTDALSELMKSPPPKDLRLRAGSGEITADTFILSEFPKLKPGTPIEIDRGDTWPVPFGNARGNARIPDLASTMRKTWTYPLKDPYNATINDRVPSQFFPSFSGDSVYVSTSSRSISIWGLSGIERWQAPSRWHSQGRALGVAVDGSHVYSSAANFTRRAQDMMKELGRRLWAFDADTGRLLWKYTEPDISQSYRITPNTPFPPVFTKGRLYAYQFREEKKIWRPWGGNHPTVVCLDPATGRVTWETKLAVVPNEAKIKGRHCDGSAPVEYGGAIYVQSNCGVIAAVDASTGDILWIKKYNQMPQAINEDMKFRRDYVSWWPSSPVVHSGILYSAPTDADSFHGMDALTGKTVLTFPRGRSAQFLGADDANLYFTELVKVQAPGTKDSHELRRVVARKRTTGEITWERELDTLICGRAAMSSSSLYVPTAKAILCLRLADGEPEPARTIATTGGAADAGNLIAVRTDQGVLAVCASDVQVTMYYDPDELLAASRRPSSHGDPSAARFMEAEVLTSIGRNAEAGDIYDKLANDAPSSASYSGRQVKTLARNRIYQAFETAARKAADAGDQPATIAAWTKAVANASTDAEAVVARTALARTCEAAGRNDKAAEACQAVIASGTRLEGEYEDGINGDLRHGAYLRINRLIGKSGRDAIMKQADLDAAKLVATGTREALVDMAERYPASASAADALEKLVRQTDDPLQKMRFASRLLSLMPQSPNARSIAPEFLSCGWAAYATEKAQLKEPGAPLWSLPKDNQDRLTTVFFACRLPAAGAAPVSQRLLLAVRDRADTDSCTLQCIDATQKKSLWETVLRSPKLEPATIIGASLARNCIVAGTGADVFGLDPSDGHIAWKYSPEAVIQGVVAAGVVAAVGLDDEIVALDSSTGAILWTHPLPGYVYAGPFIRDGFTAIVTRYPDKLFIFDLLGGTLINERKTEAISGREYSSGPWIVEVDGILGILSGGSLHAYDATSGAKLWSTPIASKGEDIAGRLVRSGPWFCVTSGTGYSTEVTSAHLVHPRTGKISWKGSASTGRNAPRGNVLNATDKYVVTTSGLAAGLSLAALYDIETGREKWRYTSSDQSAFTARILDTHVVVLSAGQGRRDKTVSTHLINLETGKGDMFTIEGGKTEVHEGYGGGALRTFDDFVLMSCQSGVYCYGSRPSGEPK
ncbi:MAG: hypothetical protein C0404_09545 [Verrucomicrobia bacterium]|nr:hypothetical protein [Verrucomicrobiota bacterium]